MISLLENTLFKVRIIMIVSLRKVPSRLGYNQIDAEYKAQELSVCTQFVLNKYINPHNAS